MSQVSDGKRRAVLDVDRSEQECDIPRVHCSLLLVGDRITLRASNRTTLIGQFLHQDPSDLLAYRYPTQESFGLRICRKRGELDVFRMLL